MKLTPQIIIAGVINGHIACKSIYTRVFDGSDRMHKRDLMAVGSWIGIAVALWVIAWIISTAIPVFSNLLSLMVSWSYMQTSRALLVDFISTDSIICELVQLWSSRYLLAISQQGTVVLFAQEDSPALFQHIVYLHWHYYGTLNQLFQTPSVY